MEPLKSTHLSTGNSLPPSGLSSAGFSKRRSRGGLRSGLLSPDRPSPWPPWCWKPGWPCWSGLRPTRLIPGRHRGRVSKDYPQEEQRVPVLFSGSETQEQDECEQKLDCQYRAEVQTPGPADHLPGPPTPAPVHEVTGLGMDRVGREATDPNKEPPAPQLPSSAADPRSCSQRARRVHQAAAAAAAPQPPTRSPAAPAGGCDAPLPAPHRPPLLCRCRSAGAPHDWLCQAAAAAAAANGSQLTEAGLAIK